MADYIFDSSGIAKRYVTETGSAWVQGLTNQSAGHAVYLAAITGVEIVSAISRRLRHGSMTAPDATAAVARFQADFTGVFRVLPVSSAIIARAMQVAQKHALRGYDAVQLAVALEAQALCASLGLPPVTLVSADTELNMAALAEGLLVENPNNHP